MLYMMNLLVIVRNLFSGFPFPLFLGMGAELGIAWLKPFR
jgi:hypothetical protein